MDSKNTIPALRKAIQLIHALAEDQNTATSAQLSRKLEIAPATCYRILQTFVACDWLRPAGGGRFEFSAGLLPLLEPLSDYQRLFEHLRAPLEKLAAQTELSAKISVKQGENAVTALRAESPRDLMPCSKIGTAFPLAYGSSGACLLSGLNDEEIAQIIAGSAADVWRWQTLDDVWARVRTVRAQGITYDAGQYYPNVHAISAPIYRARGEVFAALTLIGWPEDFAGKKQAGLHKTVIESARECATLLGG